MTVIEQTTPVEAYIDVGSNIEPEKNIPEALEKLKQYVRIKAVSTFYRTMPIGRAEQAAFLNGIWQIDTERKPRQLKFEILRSIEAELGRVRTADKYAARTIDLDIVLYGDWVINELELHIPDPDIRHRPFIAVPLLELAPALVLPDTQELLASLASATANTGLEAVYSFTTSLRERIKL